VRRAVPSPSVCRRHVVACSVVVLLTAGVTPASAPGVLSDLDPEQAHRVGRLLAADPGVAPEEVLARIEIPRVGVSAPILEGVDDVTIRRGVGHFPETPLPGAAGNVALAAHRTTHFRGLRHIQVGDGVDIVTAGGTVRYVVEETLVVDPDEVWVLEPVPGRTLTLVTCFPFDHRGRAPSRFVVRARAADAG